MNAEIIAEILERGKDDWVDFAEVMSVVRTRTSVVEPAGSSAAPKLKTKIK